MEERSLVLESDQNTGATRIKKIEGTGNELLLNVLRNCKEGKCNGKVEQGPKDLVRIEFSQNFIGMVPEKSPRS
jgi:hypothetical protein